MCVLDVPAPALFASYSRRRANTAALVEKLRLVHAVWATQPTIQQLIAARDFLGPSNSSRPHSSC